MSDLVERDVVLRCIKESAEDIDWGQSEDGDAFKHYVAAVYRTVAYPGCVPTAQPEIIKCKDCIHHHYENGKIPYCDRIDYGYGWKDDDYCSRGGKA